MAACNCDTHAGDVDPSTIHHRLCPVHVEILRQSLRDQDKVGWPKCFRGLRDKLVAEIWNCEVTAEMIKLGGEVLE